MNFGRLSIAQFSYFEYLTFSTGESNIEGVDERRWTVSECWNNRLWTGNFSKWSLNGGGTFIIHVASNYGQQNCKFFFGVSSKTSKDKYDNKFCRRNLPQCFSIIMLLIGKLYARIYCKFATQEDEFLLPFFFFSIAVHHLSKFTETPSILRPKLSSEFTPTPGRNIRERVITRWKFATPRRAICISVGRFKRR